MGRNGIAIVGLAIRVPGAADASAFWRLVERGEVCIDQFDATDAEIGARGVLADADSFDAALFRFTDAEAQRLDRQHRVFLELCWSALEDAAIDPARTDGSIAVYASCASSSQDQRPTDESSAQYQAMVETSPDFLAARVSHTLDLRGESIVVQTACSSSLVAVHLACMSLRAGQSRFALAGGITIDTDQTRGYRYEPGMVLSPDGSCRPFDQRAAGTVPASGGGVVILKRLSDCGPDDRVYAVIRGSALNNDGALKASFMAPTIRGQESVIECALADADVGPTTVEFVEAHGTATALGDAIEVEALKRTYGEGRSAARPLTVGALKGNVGHLDRAAGVAGLIKAALALNERTIPVAAGTDVPSKALGLESFDFPRTARPWPASDTPRRAGVSAFGLGGTNVHVILEESAKRRVRRGKAPADSVFAMSAMTSAAFADTKEAVAAWLVRDSPPVAHAAAALLRRPQLPRRAAVVSRSAAEAAQLLRDATECSAEPRSIVFMFQGHGSPPGTRLSLSRLGSAFRESITACEAQLPGFRFDDGPSASMSQAQPWLFALEYCLAVAWRSFGVEPALLIGHSMGEITAATLAGVFELRDALRVVAARGAALDASGSGAMLAVFLGVDEVVERIPATLDWAASNGPELTVVSGTPDDIEDFHRRLSRDGIGARRLEIGVGAHSRLLDPHLDAFRRTMQTVDLHLPSLPILSFDENGQVADETLADADHWVRQLRNPVRFGQVLSHLVSGTRRGVLGVELGSGEMLSRMAAAVVPPPHLFISSLADGDPRRMTLVALAEAWQSGCNIDWSAVPGHSETAGVKPPRYQFDHGPAVVRPVVSSRRLDRVGRLRELWAECLGREINDRTSFFEAGGDSLAAIRMVARARADGIDLPLEMLWRTPTISALAAQLFDEEEGQVAPLPAAADE
jgi:phthiocerol/phenolphthiocerol synthesis type-I polyketide synthase E